jgi:hypothetical protein
MPARKRAWPFVSLLYGILLSSGWLSGQTSTIGGCPSFPPNSIWNARIDNLPLDAHSSDYINSISAAGGLRFDITIPINIVPGTQPKVPLLISSLDESDAGPYPIPRDAQVEDGSDLHVIVVDKDNCLLYETFSSFLNPDGSWTVDSSAKWSLLSHALRPAGWTSADAAGLPIMAGLLRYEEVAAGQITHAVRFTAPRTQRLFQWPARHFASTSSSALLPPMGQRFRLKADFNVAGYAPHVQAILRAMKQYGLILADNGLPWEMQFAIDARWDFAELEVLRSIAGSNLEAVDESGLMVDADSGQAAWRAAALFTKLGVFRSPPGLGFWTFDNNGNNAFDAGDKVTFFGLPGDQPVAGDWDGTGIVRIGVFRKGLWYLDLNNNGQWDGAAGGDGLFAFGLTDDIAVAGDWNGDGRTKLGVFRCPQSGICTWVLDYAGKFAYDAATVRAVSYGLPGDIPVVNNWNASSNTDQVGVYRALPNGLGVWIVDSNGSGVWEPSDSVYQFGLAEDIPVVGNWNSGVRKRLGVFRKGVWILDTNGNNLYDANDAVGVFGLPGDRPVTGKW